MGQSIKPGPANKRARHYRELAQQAMRLADTVSDEALKAGYMAMAAGWHSLAQEAENLSAGEGPPPALREPKQPEQNGN